MATRDMFSDDPTLAGLMQTWPAFEGEVDTRALDTDMTRVAYPKPTVVREHEAIHDLCNLVDRLRAELDSAPTIDTAPDTAGTEVPTTAGQCICDVDRLRRCPVHGDPAAAQQDAAKEGYVGPVEAVTIAASNAGVALSKDDARRLADALTDMGATFDA